MILLLLIGIGLALYLLIGLLLLAWIDYGYELSHFIAELPVPTSQNPLSSRARGGGTWCQSGSLIRRRIRYGDGSLLSASGWRTLDLTCHQRTTARRRQQ